MILEFYSTRQEQDAANKMKYFQKWRNKILLVPWSGSYVSLKIPWTDENKIELYFGMKNEWPWYILNILVEKEVQIKAYGSNGRQM